MSAHPNGDVKEVIAIKALALREKVIFVRLKAGCRWDQPDRYRQDVKVVARSPTTTGAPGPRWHVTTSWDSTQKMNMALHLRQPVNRGEDILFEVIRTWPAKCLPMMREGQAEDFILRTTSLLEIQHVDYSVALPLGCDALYELIGAGEPDVQLTASTEYDHEGRRVFAWRTDGVPTLTKVGIRLELK